MNPIQFCENMCRKASSAGLKLRLEPLNDGFAWQWRFGNSIIIKAGSTDAATKPVALLFACEDIVGLTLNGKPL